ncbi:MAG: Trp family transcriptional regulator [bacterium]|nr:Trp family transcriptional regulator [bacterium]
MTKLSKRPIDPKDMDHYINNLWNALTLMESKDEIRALVKDLFTHTEYKMLAKRLEISRRLIKGETYEVIGTSLKVSDRPINSINNILANGGLGLRNANKKLLDLEIEYKKKREDRQNYLERRKRKKLPAESFLSDSLKVGVLTFDKVVTKKLKKKSARRDLNV